MEYAAFVTYVTEMIRRTGTYTLEKGTNEESGDFLLVSVEDRHGERYATLRMEALYAEYAGRGKNQIRAGIRRLLPWDGRAALALTTDDCRRRLGPDRQPMFESLRLLRAAYARRENVAPYIIFTNQALLAMCEQGPETMEGLQRLPGVGVVNSARYGDGFLELIRYHNQKRRERIPAE